MKYPWQGSALGLTPGRMSAAAETLACEVATIKTVWQVEAAGREFQRDGSLTRRFEPHHFPQKYWATIGFSPGKLEPWRASLKVKTAEREAMLIRAYVLDPEAALDATSWGGPQIMGFNAEQAGYRSALEMVTDMARSADRQVDAFVHLVQSWGLDSALRAKDWTTFARRYNGSGRVARYAAQMEQAYRDQTGAATPSVLRLGSKGASVRKLQQALNIQDDGIFGGGTERAVRAFQAANGLPVDGIVGARTWAVLEAQGAAAPTPQKAASEAKEDKAAGVSLGTVVAAGAPAVAALDGNAQLVAVGAIIVALLAVVIVFRKRVAARIDEVLA